ncbi:MAG: aspartyl protease family protein [Gemmataceae bacterium]
MIVRGKWLSCSDGVSRPVLAAEAVAANGEWVEVLFLLDTGADRTVLSAATLWQLALATSESVVQLGGVGGESQTVAVATTVRFQTDRGTWATLKGDIPAFTDPFALELSVVGRDYLSQFAVIVDQPGDFVGLVGRGHRYRLEEAT